MEFDGCAAAGAVGMEEGFSHSGLGRRVGGRQHFIACHLADVEGQRGDLPEGGGKGEQEGGHAERFAVNRQQVAACGHQCDEQQGKQDGQQ